MGFLVIFRFRFLNNVGLYLESLRNHICELHSALHSQVPAQKVLPAQLLQTHVAPVTGLFTAPYAFRHIHTLS